MVFDIEFHQLELKERLVPCIQFPYRVLSIHVGANGSESTFLKLGIYVKPS